MTDTKNIKIEELNNAAGGLSLTDEQIRWIGDRVTTLEDSGFTKAQAVAAVKRYASDSKGWLLSEDAVATADKYIW